MTDGLYPAKRESLAELDMNITNIVKGDWHNNKISQLAFRLEF